MGPGHQNSSPQACTAFSAEPCPQPTHLFPRRKTSLTHACTRINIVHTRSVSRDRGCQRPSAARATELPTTAVHSTHTCSKNPSSAGRRHNYTHQAMGACCRFPPAAGSPALATSVRPRPGKLWLGREGMDGSPCVGAECGRDAGDQGCWGAGGDLGRGEGGRTGELLQASQEDRGAG